MSNRKYYAEDFAKVDGLLRTMPISEVAGLVPMSRHTLRMRCKRLGIDPVINIRGRKLQPREINQLMMRWR